MMNLFSKQYLYIIPFFSVLILSSCASLPTDPAPWDASPAALRQIFPDSEYIAQRGTGATKAAAEAAAAAELSRFFASQISANRGYQITANNAAQTINTFDEAYVKSQINLFGIRYAHDAYYRRDLREWRTVAWIERDEAWAVYSPGFLQQAQSFNALFDAANQDQDQFRKALRFMAADAYARSDEFSGASLFGQILHPRRMNIEFENVREKIASIPQLLDAAKRNAVVYIDCPGDFENLVLSAFASRFSALGFPVTNNAGAAGAVCRVTISEGMQQRDLGIFYHPSLRAVITGSAGVLFTFSAEGERASAVTSDVAKRRAYQSLADSVRENFSLTP
ncbi:MAG: hypothetical protein FWC03_12350 [Treponema sp.]|nr:hypothetical protein [Treponema sp.]